MNKTTEEILSEIFHWLWSSLWCAGLMYAMHFIDALKSQGGWRAVLAVVLTIAGKSAWEVGKKHFATAAVILFALAASAAASQTIAAPPALGICVPATIKTVHDGDTATDVVIELHVQVRYLNCWARELSEPGGKEALDSAKQAEGKRGRLFIPLTDPLAMWKLFTFGRVLGEFWQDGATESESERQVRLGFAGKTKKLEPPK